MGEMMTIFPTSRKWLLTLLLLVMGGLGAFGAIEDYTTYTEVDTGGYLTVTDSNTLDVVTNGATASYLYKDFGADYFDGDLQINFSGKHIDITGSSGDLPGGFVLSNTIASLPSMDTSNNEGIEINFSGNVGTPDTTNIYLESLASDANDYVTASTIDTYRYFSVYRRGSIFWYNLYSDSSRTTWTHVRYTQCTAEQGYRYLYGFNSKNTSTNHAGTSQFEDLEIIENNPSAPAGTEDYTTYTEVDNGSDVSVNDSNSLTFYLSPGNVDNYVYKDMTAGHFSGDFTHELEIVEFGYQTGSKPVFWGVSNTVDDANNWADGLYLIKYSNGTTPALNLRIQADVSAAADTGSFNRGIPYYVTIIRDVTAKTCVVTYYTDRAKTNLIDTLSINLATNDVYLEDYRYIYAYSTFNSGSGHLAHGVVGNLELNESTPTPTPTAADTATHTPTDTPTVTHTPTETPTVTDTPTETPTVTDTPTITNTPSDTPTITNTPSDTPTITNTPSDTPTVTDTPTITNTPSDTPTVTNTPSDTPTITNTPSDTPTITNTPSNTATDTPTETHTPTNTSTPTVTNTPSHTPTTRPGGLDKTIGRGIGQGIGRGIR